MNTMRVFLHDLLWQDAAGFRQRSHSSRWKGAGTACQSSTSWRRCSTGRTCSTPTI
jgi:hypothetical protein